MHTNILFTLLKPILDPTQVSSLNPDPTQVSSLNPDPTQVSSLNPDPAEYVQKTSGKLNFVFEHAHFKC